MTKEIIFCADGTWCHPSSPALVEDGDTNVHKLYKCLTYTATQATFYDDGVGADGGLLRHLIGGALGSGLFQKIRDGYTAIAHMYKQGDATPTRTSHIIDEYHLVAVAVFDEVPAVRRLGTSNRAKHHL